MSVAISGAGDAAAALVEPAGSGTTPTATTSPGGRRWRAADRSARRRGGPDDLRELRLLARPRAGLGRRHRGLDAASAGELAASAGSGGDQLRHGRAVAPAGAARLHRRSPTGVTARRIGGVRRPPRRQPGVGDAGELDLGPRMRGGEPAALLGHHPLAVRLGVQEQQQSSAPTESTWRAISRRANAGQFRVLDHVGFDDAPARPRDHPSARGEAMPGDWRPATTAAVADRAGGLARLRSPCSRSACPAACRSRPRADAAARARGGRDARRRRLRQRLLRLRRGRERRHRAGHRGRARQPSRRRIVRRGGRGGCVVPVAAGRASCSSAFACRTAPRARRASRPTSTTSSSTSAGSTPRSCRRPSRRPRGTHWVGYVSIVRPFASGAAAGPDECPASGLIRPSTAACGPTNGPTPAPPRHREALRCARDDRARDRCACRSSLAVSP